MLRWKRNKRWSARLHAACALVIWLACASPARAYAVLVTEGGAHVHWREPTVTLRIAAELEDYLQDLPVTEAVREAAATWSALDGVPELLVTRGCKDAPGFEPGVASTNGVYLVREWGLLPNALAVTVTTFESGSGRLVDSDVLVNPNFSFSWLASDAGNGRYDLLSVLTHELGHVLGLGDASDDPLATMWPSIVAGDVYQRDLAPDDEAGAASIYLSDEAATELAGGAGCGGASVLGLFPNARGSRALLGVLLLLLAIWLCSRRQRADAARWRSIVLGGALLFGGPVPPTDTPPPGAPATAQGQPPLAWLPREHPAAQRRLMAFTEGVDHLFQGRAETRVERRAGLLWTRFRVQSATRSVELEVPGGSTGGVTQVISGHPAPRDGELLVIAWRKHGQHGWAHLRAGLVHGGSLGDGPALEWE